MSHPLLGVMPHFLLLLSLTPIGITAYTHTLQTERWALKRTVDTFWKASLVTLLGIGCRATLNIWLLPWCLNGSWCFCESCSSSGYWAAAKLFSFICFICVCPDAAAHPWEVPLTSLWGAVCQQKACGCIPCTASESSLQSSGLLVAVD